VFVNSKSGIFRNDHSNSYIALNDVNDEDEEISRVNNSSNTFSYRKDVLWASVGGFTSWCRRGIHIRLHVRFGCWLTTGF